MLLSILKVATSELLMLCFGAKLLPTFGGNVAMNHPLTARCALRQLEQPLCTPRMGSEVRAQRSLGLSVDICGRQGRRHAQ